MQDVQLRRAMRLEAVLEALGVSRSVFYDGIRRGLFPAPTKIAEGARSAIWFADEIAAIQARAIARRDAAA